MMTTHAWQIIDSTRLFLPSCKQSESPLRSATGQLATRVDDRGITFAADDRFGNPDAAMHQSMPRAVRGERENRSVREQAAAMFFATERHSLEAARDQPERASAQWH